ncbi:TPA: hypothetical protein ACNCHC_004623, partial [Escherichia coli]
EVKKKKGINKLKIRRAFIFILVIGASSELRHCCNGGFYCFHDSNRTYTVMTLLAPMCNK